MKTDKDFRDEKDAVVVGLKISRQKGEALEFCGDYSCPVCGARLGTCRCRRDLPHQNVGYEEVLQKRKRQVRDLLNKSQNLETIEYFYDILQGFEVTPDRYNID